MIENVLRLCRRRLSGESCYKKAVLAAVEVLAEHWVEGNGPSQLQHQIDADVELVVRWMQALCLEIKVMLDLHEQLWPHGLTFHVVEKPVVSPVTKGENE